MAAISHPLGRAGRLPFTKPAAHVSWAMLAAVGVVGLGAMLPVLQNSEATSEGFELQQLQAREAVLNGEIRMLESDVARLTSLDRIERRARDIGLSPASSPFYVTVEVAGPAPAKIPAEYLPGPLPTSSRSEPWWRSLLKWLPLPD